MSSIPLTLAEAVPLGTVMLQRLLDDDGIRSLVIKGPAFVELGVRKPKQSNDIDLLIAPEDRASALSVLDVGGWKVVSYDLPPGLENSKYSVTLRHDVMPVTVDLHHRFEGLMRQEAFEHLWRGRTSVSIAHEMVLTVGFEHALIIEALNAIKAVPPDQRKATADRVVDGVSVCPPTESLVAAASELGAAHTAGDLLRAMGAPVPVTQATPEEVAWMSTAYTYTRGDLIRSTLRSAPTHLPRVLWEQIVLTQDSARFWALTHGVPYRNRRQILLLRIRRKIQSQR